MPIRSSRRGTGETVSFVPFGAKGLDYFSDPTLADAYSLIRGENIRMNDRALSRRKGALKIAAHTDSTASKTFGATTKYATIPAASQLLIPAGGFAVRLSFVATRPAGGNTAWLLSSRPNGQTYHVLKITLSDAGVCTVGWRDNGSTDRSVATAAITAGATTHLLAIYDATAGTFTVYVNGASSGTPLTGLASTLYPIQTAGVIWALGVEKETSVAVTANTNFDGAMDAFTLFTLRGVRVSSGMTTFVSMLRRHSIRQWPTPQASCVLANYDFDHTSTTVLYDSSRFKNHGTLTGTPTNTALVALPSLNGNFVGRYATPAGKRTNLVASYGNLRYEVVRGATS